MFEPLGHTTPDFDHDTLRKLAGKATNHGLATGIEVGSWVGSTALTLTPYFDKLFCVDTFKGNPRTHLETIANAAEDGEVFQIFCANIGNYLMDRIIPCIGTSLDWAKVWPYPVDFIFIDADHEYENVLADIEAWEPHCKNILCGHDYSRIFPGVVSAVRDSFEHKRIKVEGTVWWVDVSNE